MALIKDHLSVLKSTHITEKASGLVTSRKYIFKVDNDANKIQIKQAIEKIYKVKVDKINTMIFEGKTKRMRWNRPGKRPSWKKAIVTLKKGFEIKPA